ncbi:hypothetical protein M0802_014868 [Mischocyttarus mexicanus]|nr:hypothetical protein M0802_014868 [Mischocyttarus mexicanus]
MTDTHEGSTGCSSDAVVDRMMARRSQEAKEIQLTDDMVRKMKYVELKETAKRLKLSASGTKAEVRNRLLAYVEGRRSRVVGVEDSDEETVKDSDSETEDESEEEGERRKRRKGPKCFRCNEFGHIARECQKRVNLVVASEDVKSVMIQGKEFMALVDSGSDLTLLREDKVTEIGSVKLTRTITRAEGAGNGNIRIIGAFVGEIKVDDVLCNIKVHVVPTGAIPYECILGKNFLSNVEVILRKGKVVKMVQIHEEEEKGKTKESAEQEDDTRSADGENAEAVCEEDRSTIESLTKVLSFIVARSLSSTKGFYSKSSSARIFSVYSVGRMETEWLVVSGKVGPIGVVARSSTLGRDENST